MTAPLKRSVERYLPDQPFPTLVVIAADLNGDGKIDLAAANFLFSSGASVFLGNGDGTFQAGTFYSASDEPRSLAVGDFNGDGKPDLALTDYWDDIVPCYSILVRSAFLPLQRWSFPPN